MRTIFFAVDVCGPRSPIHKYAAVHTDPMKFFGLSKRCAMQWKHRQRLLFIRETSPVSCSLSSSCKVGKRRHFSESFWGSASSSSSSIAHQTHAEGNDWTSNARQPSSSSKGQPPREVVLDKFTHFVLNSNAIPLGSMKKTLWLDILDTVDGWLEIGGGFAADSAERMLERLIYEHATRYNKSNTFKQQGKILLNRQRRLTHSWMDVAFGFSPSSSSSSSSSSSPRVNSQFALVRAEQAFFRLWNLSLQFHNSGRDCNGPEHEEYAFPIEEYVSLLNGMLNLKQDMQKVGAEKAAGLLLKVTSEDNVRLVDAAQQDAENIGPLFETCVVQLRATDPKSGLIMELLERMTALKDTRKWPIALSDAAERQLLDVSLERTEENPPSNKNERITPFEQEAMEKRLIDVLENANRHDRDETENLIRRMTKIEPSSALVFALIDYYIGIEDAEKASHWLQKLDPVSLKSSSDALENILLLWASQKGPRAAWRADEVFKMVKDRVDYTSENSAAPLNQESFRILFELWANSGDPAADRKILDWFSQMTTWKLDPDEEALKLIMLAVQKEKANVSLELASLQLQKRWESLSHDDKVWFSEAVMTASTFVGGEQSTTVAALMGRFQAEKVQPAQSLYRSALNSVRVENSSPSDVLRIVKAFENDGENITDLSLYRLAIHTLFKFEGESKTEIEYLCKRALELMKTDRKSFDQKTISDFLESVVGMYVFRKRYSEAGIFIQKAENVLLLPHKKDHATEQISPLSLGCYKRMIVRNWYTAKTAPKVQELFVHLMKLYRSGYSNLQPDSALYTGYIRSIAASGGNVEKPLQEMIHLYKSSANEELKPTTEVFNTVLLSYSRGNSKSSQAGKKSISLLNQMVVDLGVRPDTKTLSVVLNNVTKGGNPYSFIMVTNLLTMLEEHDCKPEHNDHTLHYMLAACREHAKSSADHALKTCLSTFQEIREKNLVRSNTYKILSQAVVRLVSKGQRADNVAGAILQLCLEDGRLTSEVKGNLQSVMSNSAWAMQYERNLSPDGKEPPAWSRNVPVNDSKTEGKER